MFKSARSLVQAVASTTTADKAYMILFIVVN
jgi:hypothetical protein